MKPGSFFLTFFCVWIVDPGPFTGISFSAGNKPPASVCFFSPFTGNTSFRLFSCILQLFQYTSRTSTARRMSSGTSGPCPVYKFKRQFYRDLFFNSSCLHRDLIRGFRRIRVFLHRLRDPGCACICRYHSVFRFHSSGSRSPFKYKISVSIPFERRFGNKFCRDLLSIRALPAKYRVVS